MRCKFAVRDLAQRLDATVCRYADVPVYVRVDGDHLILFALSNTEKRIKTIEASDPLFDISTPPLGYVQLGKTVYYVARRPLRKFKQGIDARSLNYTQVGQENGKRNQHSPEEILFSRGFENMCMEKYPNLQEAFKMVRSQDFTEVAVSRDIAISITKTGVIFVFYKNEEVGWIAPNSSCVKVPNSGMGWVVTKYLRGLNWEID